MYPDYILHWNSLHYLDTEQNCKKKFKKGDPFPNLVAYHTDRCACTRGQRRKKKSKEQETVC